jgi:3-methyladenine DNA glycosylase/8-oxoguanine DNA glycosylase
MHRPSADIFLPARGRFDLRATVLSYGDWQLPPYRWEDGARPVLRRAELLGRRIYLLAVSPAAGGVTLRATGPNAGEAEVLVPLAARMRKALRLDEDLAPFHRLCRAEPALRPVARLGLGRLLRGTTLFEDVVKAIAWTNTTAPAAVATLERLGRLGTRCPADRSLRTFPTPAQLVRASERHLRDDARLGCRAAFLVALARDVAAGACDLATLDAGAHRLATDDIVRTLRRIRGAGPATIGWVLMMLGRYERPAIDRATLRLATGRYGPWAGLALWFAQWLAEGRAAALRPGARGTRPGRGRPARPT